MTGALRKLNRGTRNFFKKIDSGANNFFKKTVPNVARKVGGAIEDAAHYIDDKVVRPGINTLDQAGDWVVDTSRKVGNTLEKYSSDIAMGAGLAGAGLLYATGAGAPAATALLAGSLSAGSLGKQIGGKIKQGSSALKSIQDNTVGLADRARKGINNAYSDVRRGVNQTASQATQIANGAVADVRQAGLNLQNQAKNEYQRNLSALSSNVGMAKQMARDDIKNFVDKSKARANMAILSGADTLTNSVNSVPNFV